MKKRATYYLAYLSSTMMLPQANWEPLGTWGNHPQTATTDSQHEIIIAIQPDLWTMFLDFPMCISTLFPIATFTFLLISAQKLRPSIFPLSDSVPEIFR